MLRPLLIVLVLSSISVKAQVLDNAIDLIRLHQRSLLSGRVSYDCIYYSKEADTSRDDTIVVRAEFIFYRDLVTGNLVFTLEHGNSFYVGDGREVFLLDNGYKRPNRNVAQMRFPPIGIEIYEDEPFRSRKSAPALFREFRDSMTIDKERSIVFSYHNLSEAHGKWKAIKTTRFRYDFRGLVLEWEDTWERPVLEEVSYQRYKLREYEFNRVDYDGLHSRVRHLIDSLPMHPNDYMPWYDPAISKLEQGKGCADFEMIDTSGKIIKLHQLKEKPVLLYFWVHESKPCHAYFEALNGIDTGRVQLLPLNHIGRFHLIREPELAAWKGPLYRCTVLVPGYLGVHEFPTLVLLSPNMEVLGIMKGVAQKEDILSWLEQILPK